MNKEIFLHRKIIELYQQCTKVKMISPVIFALTWLMCHPHVSKNYQRSKRESQK